MDYTNTHEVKQRACPHIVAASCERDSTRQWSHNTIHYKYHRKMNSFTKKYQISPLYSLGSDQGSGKPKVAI